jgi:RecB family endonuclease NucS
MIGKIVRRPLREVWKHEALNFTTWLVENIDVLSEVLDIPLQDAKREQAAGDFSVDLVADDGSGNTVVIENQLERSDHDHLGKIVTYLANLNARVAIWIVNESRQTNFFLVRTLSHAPRT